MNILFTFILIVLFIVNVLATYFLLTIPHYYYALKHKVHFFEDRLFTKYYMFYIGFMILIAVLYGFSRILEDSYTYFIVLLIYLAIQRLINEYLIYRKNGMIYKSKTYFVNEGVEDEVKLIMDAFPELTINLSPKNAPLSINIQTDDLKKKKLILKMLNDNEVLFKDLKNEENNRFIVLYPLFFVFAIAIIYTSFEYLFPLLHFV